MRIDSSQNDGYVTRSDPTRYSGTHSPRRTELSPAHRPRCNPFAPYDMGKRRASPVTHDLSNHVPKVSHDVPPIRSSFSRRVHRLLIHFRKEFVRMTVTINNGQVQKLTPNAESGQKLHPEAIIHPNHFPHWSY